MHGRASRAAAAAQRQYVMRRRLFNLAVAVSMVLCVATAAFWVSGHVWVVPNPVWARTQPITQTHYSVTVGQGSLQLDRLTPPSPTQPMGGAMQLGFGYDRAWAYAETSASSHLIANALKIYVPFWFIILVMAVLPVWRILRLMRAKLALRPGLCRRCGYDLRATPDRCPECGTAPAGAT